MSVDTYFCFCCFSTDDLSNLFDKIPDLNYAAMLKEIFGIMPLQEDNEDDNYICKQCIAKLKSARQFRSQVLDSINALQVIGLISIRKEDGDLIVQRVLPLSMDDKNEIIKDKEISAVDIRIKTESAEQTSDSKSPITLQQVKDIKLKTEINKNSNVMHSFLSHNPVEARERDDNTAEYPYEVPKDLICKVCDVTCTNLYNYHVHMNKHYPNHVCEICGKGFVTAKRLNRHKYCHNTGPFVCQECGKQYHNYSTFSAHRHKHTSILPYACPVCPARFKSLSSRARHADETHRTRSSHRCPECSMEFLTAGLLSSHIKYKHLKIKRHMCKICGAGFYHRQELVEHATSHSGLKPFPCHYCDKSYSRKKALKVHLQIHSDDKRFSCDTCGKRFLQKCTLTYHLKTHNKKLGMKSKVETNDNNNI